jgi:catechol 2,3-dioxygenase-like lactoylglutathione lyase family enzyme
MKAAEDGASDDSSARNGRRGDQRRVVGGKCLAKPAVEPHMTKPEISGIAPLFIVSDVPAALAFYRDRLGIDITFQGPEPDDIFFGIVQRGAAMIMFKDVSIDPVPNHTRDVNKGIARWDAYLHVPDPDALAAEFSSRKVEFSEPLKDTDDGLRGFELEDADGYVLFFGRPRS